MADTQDQIYSLFTGSSAKCKCKASCSRSIKNFKIVTEEHHTSAGPLCDCIDHIPAVIGKKTSDSMFSSVQFSCSVVFSMHFPKSWFSLLFIDLEHSEYTACHRTSNLYCSLFSVLNLGSVLDFKLQEKFAAGAP